MAHSVHVKKEQFLKGYAETGNIRDTARSTGIGRRTHDNWLKADDWYRKAFQDLRREALNALVSEARRRAVQGVQEPHYDKDGNLTHVVRKYSDALLIVLLKANGPRKYGGATGR
ncbi:MAG TPA: hypothetical protein VMV94_05405 [Phycisphaerae bacterium]|nr:hypothetical protein [Phycisphaerae bacterium]